MISVLRITFLIVALGFVAIAQSPINKQVNVEGWAVPDTARLKVADERPVKSLHESTYVLDELKPSIKLRANTFCEFRDLRTYKLDDRVVAIEGFCVIFTVQKSTTRRFSISSKLYAGAITYYTYIDEDGNGDFESRYNSSDYLDLNLILSPRIRVGR